jgi:hypothetical protein
LGKVVDITNPDIAERFRNTYSHGAFGSRGRAAMFVQVPDVGVVPVTLGQFGVRPELFVPAVKDDFDGICRVFDSCDQWLANGPLADGYRWALLGLDYRFDPEFRGQVFAALSEGRFEQFLDDTGAYVDRPMNMDF